MPFTHRVAALAAVVTVGSLLAVAAQATPRASLYARMGGTPVVSAIVSDTVDQMIADPHLNQSFEGVNTRRLKSRIVEFICQVAGGGCRYQGDTMRAAHANLHITEGEFYGMVAILREQMRRHHVGLSARNELLAILAPMKRDIVRINVPPPRAQ